MKQLIQLMMFVMLCKASFAQYAPFNKTYNFAALQNNDGSYLSDVICEDSSFLAAGVSDSLNIPYGNPCPILSRIDYKGNVLWKKCVIIGGITKSSGYNFMGKISANKYFITGIDWDTAIISPYITHFPYLYIFDKNGDSLFSKIYKDSFDNKWVACSAITSDHYIMLGGLKESYKKHIEVFSGINYVYCDTQYIFLSKYDTLGNEIWTKTYYPKYNNPNIGSNYFVQNNMVAGDNGSVIMSGTGQPIGPKYDQNYFIKIDSSGNLQWIKHYGQNPYISWLFNNWICTDSNQGYYFVTDMSSLPLASNGTVQDSKALYGHINNNGDTLWTKHLDDLDTFGNEKWHEVTQIKYINHKLYLLSSVLFEGDYHPTLIILDTLGNVKSYRNYAYYDYNVSGQNYLSTLNLTPNNNILMSLYTQNLSPIPGVTDSVMRLSWVVMTDSVGCLQTGCQAIDTIWNVHVAINETHKSELEIKVYPNPTTGVLNFLLTEEDKMDLIIYNNTGQTVYSEKKIFPKTIDISSFSSGYYFVRLIRGEQQRVFKIEKE